MNRLQKKCFIASAGFHLLLAAILFIGPGFISSKTKSEDWPVLTFVPDITTDQPFSHAGGGAPRPQAPVPVPPQPQPQVSPPQVIQRQPDPPKIVERTRDDSESVEASTQPKKRSPQISTTPVVRKTNSKNTPKQKNETETQQRDVADARKRAADQILNAARDLRNGLSSATSIESSIGEGSGLSYANYAQWVKTVYEEAWVPPDDTSNDDANTKVSVTIASDGRVIDSHIIGRSGESRVDGSVQRTLDRVTNIGKPFPEGSKDKQRTYTINFNLKAKRGLG
jgi:TonB family protein